MRQILQESITTLNLYSPNNRAMIYMGIVLREVQAYLGKSS